MEVKFEGPSVDAYAELSLINEYGRSQTLYDEAAIYVHNALVDLARLRARCQMIVDIGYDHDGYVSAEKLGELIDELVEWARGEHDDEIAKIIRSI